MPCIHLTGCIFSWSLSTANLANGTTDLYPTLKLTPYRDGLALQRRAIDLWKGTHQERGNRSGTTQRGQQPHPPIGSPMEASKPAEMMMRSGWYS